MKIDLRMERLILEDVPISRAQALKLRFAIESELTQLLTEGALPPAWRQNAAIRNVDAGQIRLDSTIRPAQLGRHIAHAVYRAAGSPHTNPGDKVPRNRK